MSKKTNHVIPSAERGGWAVKKSGAAKSSRSFDKKSEAILYARTISKKEQTELFIHRKDGTIQNRNSYGQDPFPPKDRKH